MYWKDYFYLIVMALFYFFCMTCLMSLFLIVSTLVGRVLIDLHFFQL